MICPHCHANRVISRPNTWHNWEIINECGACGVSWADYTKYGEYHKRFLPNVKAGGK